VKEYIQARVRKLILRFGGCSCLGGWENKNQNFKKQMSHLTQNKMLTYRDKFNRWAHWDIGYLKGRKNM